MASFLPPGYGNDKLAGAKCRCAPCLRLTRQPKQQGASIVLHPVAHNPVRSQPGNMIWTGILCGHFLQMFHVTSICVDGDKPQENRLRKKRLVMMFFQCLCVSFDGNVATAATWQSRLRTRLVGMLRRAGGRIKVLFSYPWSEWR